MAFDHLSQKQVNKAVALLNNQPSKSPDLNKNNHHNPTFHPLGDFLNPAFIRSFGAIRDWHNLFGFTSVISVRYFLEKTC
jgi:hypothetical protein